MTTFKEFYQKKYPKASYGGWFVMAESHDDAFFRIFDCLSEYLSPNNQPANEDKIIKDAALHLTIAADYLDDYLTAFPDCNGRAAMMKLSRDMNDLSLFIETENKK